MPVPLTDAIVVGGLNPVEGKIVSVPSHQAINEKVSIDESGVGKELASEIQAIPATTTSDDGNHEKDDNSDNAIIITGADAARYLLPLRDDFDPALTFRSMFLATCLSAFQAVMSQIYTFKPTAVTISGTFIVLIGYFVGKAWSKVFPRGDKLEARWRQDHPEGELPAYVKIFKFFNPGPWGLKEHAICSITATSASNAAASIQVFAAQDLFYDLPLSPTTVVLTVISIGLFGYGICGVMRPIAVWHVDAVYWSTLPTVKTLQGLHWQDLKNSKPLRWFWYSFAGMFVYEFFPAYIFPWLNSVSIPCLAAMNATGSKAAVLTNLFGGSINNEGLGLFSLSFDWQYITSFNTSLPLTLQAHSAIGFFICFLAMIGIYYTNAWDAKSQPFMSTRLRSEDGTAYPIAKVFTGGVLNQDALAKYGIPRLTGSFAYAMFMANAAIGALVAHCFFFWGGDVKRAYQSAKSGRYDDRHHDHMTKHYKETPWWWYVIVLVVSFVLGLVVVTTQNVTLPAWAYVVSLLLGIFIAPLSTILYSRFGNGIATNNLSKMLAGLILPERPIGNMYFAAWSHNVISNAVNLSNDLKMGEYLKIPPRVMFLTQIYGTIIGGFINYAVMISIVNGNRELLVDSDGNSSWSGATMQSYNTNATSWALAKYLYKTGGKYALVPIGLGIGFGVVIVHRIIAYFIPKIRGYSLYDINLPQLIQYAGYIPYNASQTCVLFSSLISGFFVQFYLRNYRPRIFKDYSYLVTGAFDGASLTVLFILSFAVFGAGGPSVPFPTWWGNNADGYYDHCPAAE
ncbi:OPT oligopeptide transporter [Colletotrichum abscissum]|uniref:OPT oligopeptide transporter n=2 Tax=Colletotrichum acutatum species complex TaxID=2707335 RepID=A0A9P9X3Y2_9PEZI|nr:OPT oligopeptide transporter [Colletotrichum costaricense]XP_060389534.1 OPT oligopeptide transporter [Colletotrichum abscissum]KAI3535430.1 OPT oligopeptide transporter [Colletotrichum abscissum]KAK1471719.1 OPT oligopeptide transporter [Colletotrichum abscissum]KAK1535257.1 OPT oligopeptide transporter [Colletotrichum costaricense]